MTVRFYTDPRASHEGVNVYSDNTTGEKYFEVNYKSPRQITPLTSRLARLTQKVDWYGNRWNGDGYHYQLGIYRGEGWKVEITKKYDTRGSGPTRMRDVQYEISGTFATLALAQAFEEQLDYGSLQTTFPLGGDKMHDDPVAVRASFAVANSAAIRELQALVAQQANQLQALAQLVQDYVLTPKKASQL
jgi:hypothetical protein